MYEKEVSVQLKVGLQARQAAHFVQQANRFRSEVFLQKGDKRVNAKSIMGVMSLAVAKDTMITLAADGDDEKDAVEALAQFISDN